MGLFDFLRGKKPANQATEDPNITRRGMCKHSLAEFKALTDDDVIHVLMLHEASTTSHGYEQYVLSYMLPNLSRSGFTRIDSMHAVNPKSPDAAREILKRHGYDDFSLYAVAHEFVNAGEGITAVLAVMRAVVMGKTVLSLGGSRHTGTEPVVPKPGEYFISRGFVVPHVYGKCISGESNGRIQAEAVSQASFGSVEVGPIPVEKIIRIISPQEFEKAKANGWP